MSHAADGEAAGGDDAATSAARDGSGGRDRSADDPAAETTNLVAQVELLREENRRLRREYALTRRVEYRRTALGLGGVGTAALAGAVLFPSVRTVSLALAGTGLFAAVLTWYLTPERFIPAETGERVYAALATNAAALVADLGLSGQPTYVPVDGDPPVRLFVAHRADVPLPDREELDGVLVVPGDESRAGVAFEPTGAALLREFERSETAPLPTDPAALTARLAEGLVESLGLSESAAIDVDAGRAAIRLRGGAYGSVDRFDHPLASFLAVGLAVGLDAPVTVETTPGSDDTQAVVTCRWDPADVRRDTEDVEETG